MKSKKLSYISASLILVALMLAIILNPVVIINAGQRGILMEFGQVQDKILGEGIHAIIPIANTVETLSVRIQKQEIPAQAASKDLQDVFVDVAVNWHIIPEKVNRVFQQIGSEINVVERIINPAIEEVLKAVLSLYNAEQIITKRGEVKAEIDQQLTSRLAQYNIAIDDISLVNIHFSQRFNEAVEAKQIAEQEAKRAEFLALKAVQEAQAEINRAKGQAEAQELLREDLTPLILQKQAIDKWDGHLPTVLSQDSVLPFINISPSQLSSQTQQ